MLEGILGRVVALPDTFRIIAYKGIGHIPHNLGAAVDAPKRILLNNLPRLLRGYGKAFNAYGSGYAMVVIICDLDEKDQMAFERDLEYVLVSCSPKPDARFCLAIEEGEAWLLGDTQAVVTAYPNARRDVLDAYVKDSICGTWEILANAVFEGGEKALRKRGHQAIGKEKFKWAENISPHIRVERNESPSFLRFLDVVRPAAIENLSTLQGELQAE